MAQATKVFGIGLAKTGTTTLAASLDVLGIGPHKSYDGRLRAQVRRGRIEKALKVAARYRSFEDAPWNRLYPQLDRAFPGSKFVLTLRKDTETHARSSWEHGVRAGVRRGAITAEYLAEKSQEYEAYNDAVRAHFHDRPEQLLELCWENGDGWESLCPFLGVPIPDQPISHANQGSYRGTGWLRSLWQDSVAVMALRRARLAAAETVLWLRDSLRDR